jgi:hypothetical protein
VRAHSAKLLKKRIIDALPFFALFNIALHPLYTTIAKAPAFLLFHNLTNTALLCFVLALSLLPPLALFLIYALVGRLGTSVQNTYRAIVFALLTTFILMPAVRDFHSLLEVFLMFWFLLLSFIVFFVGYRKFSWMKSYLLFLSPAILIVPALFLTNWQIKKLFAAEKEVQVSVIPKNPAPVIILVFDEFPLVTLLNKNLQIDSHLFPNFYKLSQQASFYRNATTSADQTIYAIPAILTGKYPKPRSVPVPLDYPNTLFTLLRKTYSMQGTEFGTKLFPNEEGVSRTTSRSISQIVSDLSIIYGHLVLPQPLKSRLPSVTNNWGNFTIRQNQIRNPDHRAGRQKTFDDFLASLKPQQKPILRYLHILLPHRIWEFLPSGKIYDPFEIESITMGQTVSWENETIVKESYQRLLLQVQFLDRLIGQLITKLEQESLYDPSLLILVGDHGLGLTEHEEFRKVENNNYPEMLWVPLLIKYPNQKAGKTVDWNVESVDILPTIAEVLQFSLPWKGDGYSLMQSEPSRKVKKCFTTDEQAEKEFAVDLNQIQPSVDRKIEWFGEETSSNLFMLAPAGSVIGKPMVTNTSTAVTAEIEIHKSERFEDYDPDSGFVPALITGTIQSSNLTREKRNLAIAVNGIFQATCRTRPLLREGVHSFRAMVPENAFVKGKNEIKVYLQDASGRYVSIKSTESIIASHQLN